MTRLALLLALSAATAVPLASQTPSFEVVSVRPNMSGESDSQQWTFVNGRFTGINVTVRMLLMTGYGQPQPLPDYLIVGGPDWIGSARFDVVATAENGAALPLLLRQLVEDRFKVRAAFQKRNMPIYELILSTKGGSLGPAIRRNNGDCDGRATGPPCVGQIRPGLITGRGLTMERIASALARVMPSVGRPVIDRTGLVGAFDFSLSWTPDQAVTNCTPGIPTIDPNGPSIFTALQEQLGLKLEAARGPVEVLVIDSVERPTPD